MRKHITEIKSEKEFQEQLADRESPLRKSLRGTWIGASLDLRDGFADLQSALSERFKKYLKTQKPPNT